MLSIIIFVQTFESQRILYPNHLIEGRINFVLSCATCYNMHILISFNQPFKFGWKEKWQEEKKITKWNSMNIWNTFALTVDNFISFIYNLRCILFLQHIVNESVMLCCIFLSCFELLLMKWKWIHLIWFDNFRLIILY